MDRRSGVFVRASPPRQVVALRSAEAASRAAIFSASEMSSDKGIVLPKSSEHGRLVL